jgi:uncharacterized membrane protein YedE/YeeE
MVELRLDRPYLPVALAAAVFGIGMVLAFL